MVAAKGNTTAAKTKASKVVKSPPSHPPYIEMAKEAIVSLNERTGSSHYAIAKFIEGKQGSRLRSNFKKLLFIQLKRLVAVGKLVKVKNSFKVPSAAAVKKPASPGAKKVLKRKAGAISESRPAKAPKTAAAAGRGPARAKKVAAPAGAKKPAAPSKAKKAQAKAAAKKPKTLKSQRKMAPRR